jgi:membrane fusion protein, multidrug efflux system
VHLSLSSVGRLFSLVVIVAATVLLFVALYISDSRPSTNDAYLQADLVRLAPEVSGRIVALPIRDNQAVKKGDLLFAIDPEPYRLRLEQARAQVAALEASIKVQTDQVASQISRARAAETGTGSAQAQLELALSTLARLEPLGRQGFVPKEQVDQARTAMMVARNAVAQSNQQAQETRQAVTSTAPLEAQLDSAKALAALAERDLRLTEVRAAFDGKITGLDLTVGQFATVGVPLFTVINTEKWYAVANFRESDLRKIREGQQARVFVMANPARPIGGKVESIGWGVVAEEGITVFGGLPRVPRTLNWVRIAQRFPVRILLDAPPDELMRVGSTVSVTLRP